MLRYAIPLATQLDDQINGPEYFSALARLDRLYPILQAGWQVADAAGNYVRIMQLAEAVGYYQGHRALWQEGIDWRRSAVNAAEALDNPQFKATAQNNLGNAYGDLPTGDRAKNLAVAIKCYQEALGVFTPQSRPLRLCHDPKQLGHRLW